MQNNHDNSQKIVVGLLIGAVVGAGALYCINHARHQHQPALHKIGRAISEVGAMLENSQIESFSDVAHEIQDAFPKGKDVISSLLSWLSSGMDLWKKTKTGG